MRAGESGNQRTMENVWSFRRRATAGWVRWLGCRNFNTSVATAGILHKGLRRFRVNHYYKVSVILLPGADATFPTAGYLFSFTAIHRLSRRICRICDSLAVSAAAAAAKSPNWSRRGTAISSDADHHQFRRSIGSAQRQRRVWGPRESLETCLEWDTACSSSELDVSFSVESRLQMWYVLHVSCSPSEKLKSDSE